MNVKGLRVFYFFLVLLCIFAIVAIASSFFPRQVESGCPVAEENSTAEAQVFLMGTIGGDYEDPNRDCWREYIIQPVLDQLGVSYYNPVVSNWSEENAKEEAYAIAHAEVIVLVITDHSPSIGSLSESGWAVLSALERNQHVIAFIENHSDDPDSARARRIVLSQAQPLAPKIDELTLVDSIDDVVVELRALYGD